MPTSRSNASGKSGDKSKAVPRKNAGPPGATDLMAQQASEVDVTAAGMPFNANKKAEHGRAGATMPPEGMQVVPPSDLVGASTLSESVQSEKLGSQAVPGVNATIAPLDRVRVDSSAQRLTTNQGVPVADNQNSLKAGVRGPALLKDFILREKITHFDHERIPERIVHARGSGAHGFFEAYSSLSDITCATPFQQAGKITPTFVRFSTVAGERGSKDTARDVRGFAVKFYTDEGNWDLVGNNIPVFFIQDAMKFPDLVHAVKPEPHHGMPQAASAHDTFWDFVSLMPESMHMLMWVMSDRAIPRSFRMMQGFGVHTFRMVNAAGHSVFVKFHWNPLQGTHSLVWDEAVKVSGADPDFHRRDLWESIEAGEYPEWELGLQIFTEEQAEAFSFDVLDSTKLIPEELVPVTPVGRLVLNRNPDNFFAETEQVAFCTAHVVPGIDFTNDPLLAGRIHSYVDTQISRLGGPNFHEIPINAPVAQIHNNQRDGMHRQAINRGRVAYEPNSLGGGCPFQAGRAGFVSFPEPVQSDEVRGKPERFAEHYNQATLFFDSQSKVEQDHIVNAFRFELSKLTVPAIRERVLSMLANVSDELVNRVAGGLGLPVPAPMPRALEPTPAPEVSTSPSLSLMIRPGTVGIRTRKISVFVADGIDAASVSTLQAVLKQHGARPVLIGPRVGPFTAADGSPVVAESSFETDPGAAFDAMVIPDGDAAKATFCADARALEHIKEQYRHCKTIFALGPMSAILDECGISPTLPNGEPDPGVLSGEATEEHIGRFVAAVALHRHWDRETDPPRV